MKRLPDSILEDSFHGTNFSAFKVPIITIYDKPADFPESFVARIYDLDQWTPYAMVKPTLKAIREGIPSHRFYRLDRMMGDDPNIVEVWV